MHNKKSIQALVLIIAIAAGFFAGTTYSKSVAVSNRQGVAGATFYGANGMMGSRGMRGMGGFTAGKILSVDQSSVTLQMQDGSNKIVLLGPSTSVLKSVSGTSADLTAGETVMVQGSTNSDGSMTAQSIQIRPIVMPAPKATQ